MLGSDINILYADRNFNITYANPQSIETLKKVEEYLPIKVDNLIGTNIDVFHKNPAHQRKILSDDKNLPYKTIIRLGPEKLDLLVTAVYNENRVYMGAMVTWDIVTQKLASEESLNRNKQMLFNFALKTPSS